MGITTTVPLWKMTTHCVYNPTSCSFSQWKLFAPLFGRNRVLDEITHSRLKFCTKNITTPDSVTINLPGFQHCCFLCLKTISIFCTIKNHLLRPTVVVIVPRYTNTIGNTSLYFGCLTGSAAVQVARFCGFLKFWKQVIFSKRENPSHTTILTEREKCPRCSF